MNNSYHAQLLPLDFLPGIKRASVGSTGSSPSLLRAAALAREWARRMTRWLGDNT